MTSFVIASKQKESLRNHAVKLCRQFHVHKFDIHLIKKEDLSPKKKDGKMPQNIGIEEVKQMQGKLFLKPLNGKTKAVIIADAEFLTIPAQNALLKLLEEPPANTIIMLLTDSVNNLLPTILSRCTIIQLTGDQQELTPTEKEAVLSLVSELDDMTVAKALELAEQLAKNKNEALLILEHVILQKREQMLQSTKDMDIKDKQVAHSIEKLQNLLTDLKSTNVNPRLAIEAILLSML